MPLPMVHLLAADQIQKTIHKHISRAEQYFLGSIVPDAIHMREGATLKDKDVTHLDKFRPGLIERTDALLRTQWDTFPDRDLLLGYCVHLYTDAYWNEILADCYIPVYQVHGIFENSVFRQKYYTDVDPIDLRLYVEQERAKEILKLLRSAEGIDFLDLIRAEEMDRWNDRTQNWFDRDDICKETPYGIIFYEDIVKHIDSMAHQISAHMITLGFDG